jgi:hypothetical protein
MDGMVETDETDDDWLSQQPVTAVGYAVTCLGIGNPAIEDQLVTNVRTIVDIFSQAVDLSGLDGITIAADYRKALATLDRGYETDHVLTPTTEGATGVAMSPLVKRNGVLKTHIVLDAALMLALLDTAATYHSIARMTLVHECVHVYEHTSFNKAFPGFFLQKKIYRRSRMARHRDGSCMLGGVSRLSVQHVVAPRAASALRRSFLLRAR